MKIKPSVCVPVLVLSLSIVGCQRSYQEAALVGSWQTFTAGAVTQWYTFSSDHRFTSSVASSKDLRHFGDWALVGDQLSMVVRSQSFSPTIVSNRETSRIIKLTDETLVARDRDRNDEPRERTFKRLR